MTNLCIVQLLPAADNTLLQKREMTQTKQIGDLPDTDSVGWNGWLVTNNVPRQDQGPTPIQCWWTLWDGRFVSFFFSLYTTAAVTFLSLSQHKVRCHIEARGVPPGIPNELRVSRKIWHRLVVRVFFVESAVSFFLLVSKDDYGQSARR